ncbi:MAG: hypothetical protein KY410_05140, partial [Proteobacteria bacterium]|nr:hypothetical protein [Pseudomonadota bacterium]
PMPTKGGGPIPGLPSPQMMAQLTQLLHQMGGPGMHGMVAGVNGGGSLDAMSGVGSLGGMPGLQHSLHELVRTLRQLTMALQGFEGAVITVSHDRHLLENTVTDYTLIANGKVREFDGDLNDYRKWLNQERLDLKNEKSSSVNNGSATPLNRKAARKAAADERAALQALRNRSKKLLEQIDRHSATLKELETELSDSTLYDAANKTRLDTLLKKQAKLRKDVEALEAEWSTVEEELEMKASA